MLYLPFHVWKQEIYPSVTLTVPPEAHLELIFELEGKLIFTNPNFERTPTIVV